MSSIVRKVDCRLFVFTYSPPLLLSGNGCLCVFLENLVAFLRFFRLFSMLFAESKEEFELVGRAKANDVEGLLWINGDSSFQEFRCGA